MMRFIFCYFLLIFLCRYAAAHQNKYSKFCKENDRKSISCNSQLSGQQPIESNVCTVEHYAPDSPKCKYMDFGPFQTNTHIGGVSLKPYLLDEGLSSTNFTVLNITFTNIKWKTMKFRFQPTNYQSNHCRNIILSNDFPIDDQSILYYDCYWSFTDGDYNNTSHILDFIANDGTEENRGQYYFNIPTVQMLSPNVTENEWKPFLYIETLPSVLRLHIMPPPVQLKISGYKIEIRKGCAKGVTDCHDELVKRSSVLMKNYTQEITSDFYYLGSSGLFYFVVTPTHEQCSNNENKCQVVVSPKISISNEVHKYWNICIASVTALVVATLFAYYVLLRLIRRYWCKDYALAEVQDIPAPTKVLVIYSPTSRLHAECVSSFVNYLRSEYGFDVMHEADICCTPHGDPYIWAEDALKAATHVLYIVGPGDESNLYKSIYEKPIVSGAHKDVDILLLSMLRAYRASRHPKDISNVFFEHSNGAIPMETKHGNVFFLLKDWQKLISHLSKNMLPKKQIMRTEKGRCFLDDLTKAKKLLGSKCEKEKILV
ncbi:unnamed protein product [Diatraea saccharalis]|uniref:SEFIR domain-containing protein n=1 Tax=Diatraea saccharalis TaxID=40085 RepID=A0A9N9QZM6_9NEOP|nr:unnamed protein product [Diatraea saccharalis]